MLRVGLALICLALCAEAAAHQRSLSFSRWTLGEDSAQIEFRITELELTRFPAGVFAPEYLSARLQLLRDGVALTPGPILRKSAAADGWAIFEWEIPFEPGGDLAIRSDVFLDIISGHQHFVRLAYASAPNAAPAEKLFTEHEREWVVGRGVSGNSLVDYIRMGVEHILEGSDHLAFVLTLLLLALSVREVAVLVTGFTIAHSMTLALAVLGVFKPVAPVVEIYVAFSIALIAIENLWWSGQSDRFAPVALAAVLLIGGLIALAGSGMLSTVAWAGLTLFALAYFASLQEVRNPFRLRAVITFTFGLVHGFGFAGVLMDLGLPSGRTALGLFGFNLGVEFGQLAVVLLAWPVSIVLRRIASGRLYPALADAGSAAALALAAYWFTTRNWG